MATATKRIGPADHGLLMTLEEFEDAQYDDGYQYELIDGGLYVSPSANLPQSLIERWLLWCFESYCRLRPDITNEVLPKARVFIPKRKRITVPEPDIAVYRDFPKGKPISSLRWQDVSPLLVVEVLSADDPEKDLVRNVDLYWQVPSIKEYWIADAREDADKPTMLFHRRHGKKWRVKKMGYGDTYTTRLLPEFSLLIDPRS